MPYTRRDFVKTAGAFSLLPFLGEMLSAFMPVSDNPKITAIELYRFDINIPRYFSHGVWHNRQHVFMRILAGDHYGWAETPASINKPELNVENWGAYLKELIGKDVNQALELLQSRHTGEGKWNWKELEFAEMGLFDLMGRIQDKPGIELLGLTGRDPVPGIFCILEKDPAKVKERARQAIEQRLDQYVKVKIFGTKELDVEVIKAAKEVIGPDSFLIADANNGYKNWKSIDELAEILNTFERNGLYGLEDPALMEVGQWIELQNKVGKLNLIPDHDMRPAWEAVHKITPGMGRIFNLHPSVMGSFRHLVKASEKIKSIGAGVMIGDDSLVGPACTFWQQIAIGVGAKWVEALEKEGDSDEYIPCVTSKATYRDSNGKFAFNPKPGFGLELDTDLLRSRSKQYARLV